ncbi:hypothetical protein [Nostoc sp. UHCC 0870]|uniref:hypothetical protein n=1 Tax=Nostoc sp. UHCC 0870 TaxID=2914041 RepID=UPI001EDD371C|nr:hypothetical protein [Nostoc sp. UHCC 0870]UKP00093.1 hypothetical protein L6494_10480 [Nostoc sp. UHCC 0870]
MPTYSLLTTQHGLNAALPLTALLTPHSALITHNSSLSTQHRLNAALPLTALSTHTHN